MDDINSQFEAEIRLLHARLTTARGKLDIVKSYNTPSTTEEELDYLDSQIDQMVSAYRQYFGELSDNLKARIIKYDTCGTAMETKAFLQQLIEFNLEANLIGVDSDFWKD